MDSAADADFVDLGSARTMTRTKVVVDVLCPRRVRMGVRDARSVGVAQPPGSAEGVRRDGRRQGRQCDGVAAHSAQHRADLRQARCPVDGRSGRRTDGRRQGPAARPGCHRHSSRRGYARARRFEGGLVFERYGLVLLPGLVLLAGFGADRWFGPERPRTWPLAAIVLAACLIATTMSLWRSQRIAGETDVDVLAAQWVTAPRPSRQPRGGV